MLPDYKQTLFAPLKMRQMHMLIWKVTFSSGVATVVAGESSPTVTCVKNTTGVYDLTFPKGSHGVPMKPVVVNTAGGIGNDAYFVTFDPVAGTAQLEFDVNTAAATAADPADTCTLYLVIWLGRI